MNSGCPVETKEVLLQHPPHDVGDVDAVAVLRLAGEPVRIDQRHEGLELVLMPRMWGGGHEKNVPSRPAECLTQDVTLRALQFVAVVRGAHLVSLVDHHQIPLDGSGLCH